MDCFFKFTLCCMLTLTTVFSINGEELGERHTRIFVVRHGQSEWNIHERIQGQINTDLTEHGHHQARTLVTEMIDNDVEIHAIYASPLDRAFNTAQHIAGQYDLMVSVDERLMEIHWGEAQGMTVTEKKERFGDSDFNYSESHLEREENWTSPQNPGAESFYDALQRVHEAIDEIAARHVGETVVIATHSGIVKLLSAYALEGHPPNVPNCAIAEFRYYPEHPRLLTYHGINDFNAKAEAEEALNLQECVVFN